MSVGVLGPDVTSFKGGVPQGKAIKVSRTKKKTESETVTLLLDLNNLHPGDKIVLSAKNAKGVKHASITMYPIGGVARLEGMPIKAVKQD